MLCVAFHLGLALQVAAANAPAVTAPFTVHVIASGIQGGYQVAAADLNHDGRIDVIGLGQGAASLLWYENPSWTPHVIVSIPRMVNVDTADLDGDGIPEIAVAYGFSSVPANSSGNIGILHTGHDPRQPWTLKEIDQQPTAHRLRFMDVDGSGKKVLIVAPVLNPKSPGFDDPGHLANPLLMYRPENWKRQVITEENKGVVHGLLAFDWYGNGRQDALTAGYGGVYVNSLANDGTWARLQITAGNPVPWPHGGAGEVAAGKINGKQFFVTIEPFHGNMVVVYTQDPTGAYQRHVIDSSLVNGHTLTLADVDGDGVPEIVAAGNGSRADLYFFKAVDAAGRNWQKMLMDNDIAPSSCVAADIKGKGQKTDIVCIDGKAPNYLKCYEYHAK